MTLQSSGQISISDVNLELGYASTRNTNLNEFEVRTLFGKPSGLISLSDGLGKTLASGSITYSTPGTYTFTVPFYKTLTVVVSGAGGGGGLGRSSISGSSWVNSAFAMGAEGGTSAFYGPQNIISYGGKGGRGPPAWTSAKLPGPNGDDGTSTGGIFAANGNGGLGGNGGVASQQSGGKGGNGGFTQTSFFRSPDYSFFNPGYTLNGAPVPYTQITIQVGAGGPGAVQDASGQQVPGQPGGHGFVYVAWA